MRSHLCGRGSWHSGGGHHLLIAAVSIAQNRKQVAGSHDNAKGVEWVGVGRPRWMSAAHGGPQNIVSADTTQGCRDSGGHCHIQTRREEEHKNPKQQEKTNKRETQRTLTPQQQARTRVGGTHSHIYIHKHMHSHKNTQVHTSLPLPHV